MTFSSVSPNYMAEHAIALEVASIEPGAQRLRAAEALRSIGAGHAFTVPYGSRFARISGDGKAFEVTKKNDVDGDGVPDVPEHDEPSGAAEGRSWIHDLVIDTSIVGSAPLNKVVDGMPIPFGVCVLVAGSGVGKTPLAHRLASEGVTSYGVVRIGEPFAGYTTNQAEAAFGIGCAAVHHADVVVDSIKDLLAQAGSAMKGGIARNALTDLSFWSILGATLGTTFYVPLNPSTGDADTLKMLIEVAKSNTSMTVSNEGGAVWSFSTRLGEGMERASGQYSMKPRSAMRRERSLDLIIGRDPREVGRDVFSGAIHRATLLSA